MQGDDKDFYKFKIGSQQVEFFPVKNTCDCKRQDKKKYCKKTWLYLFSKRVSKFHHLVLCTLKYLMTIFGIISFVT